MTEDSPNQTTPGSDVFVSYASQDTAAANAIVEALERNGLRCWIAPRDVRAGAQYADAIVRAIGGAKVFVLVLSANAGASSHVGKEIERASSKKRPIIALRIDAAPLTPALEYFLSESQWIEAQAGMMETAYAKLIDAIREPDRTVPNNTPAAASGASVRAAPAPRQLSRRNRILFAAALAVVATILAALWANFRPAEQVTAEQATTAAGTAVSDKSIAVLPLVNMSSDKDQEYFADGLSEELLNLLAKLPELRVTGRTSSFQFKGRNEDLRVIGEKLNVAYILEGSVRKSGEKVRITAQLIRAADGTHLWSETYDREMSDIFAVQDEIAGVVVDKLRITLLAAAPKANAVDPEAYTLFLQARDIGRQYTASAYENAIALLQRAIKLDDAYAAAWAALADIYYLQAIDRVRPIDESVHLAQAAVEAALRIDPNNALGHSGLATIAIAYDRDLGAAARHLEHALTLEPANLDVIGMAAFLARRLGRLEQAIALGEYQVARDPANSGAHDELARAFMLAGHFDEAIAEFRTAMKLSPSLYWGHGSIGELLLLIGNPRAALAEAQQEVDPLYRSAVLAMANHALGQKAASDAALRTLIAQGGMKSALDIATALAYRGELDRSFEWLDKAFEYHDLLLNSVAGHPTLANLHKDPRWLPFLRKINMAPEQLAAIKFDVKVPVEAAAQ